MKHGNLRNNENRKGSNHRKMRLKVEKYSAGAESSVVVLKFLQWKWSKGMTSFSLNRITTRKLGGFDEREQTIRYTQKGCN